LKKNRVYCQICLNLRLKINKKMGKGDRKTKRGKIIKGSNGNTRPKKKNIIKAKKEATA